MAKKKAPLAGVEAQAAVRIPPELLEQLVPGPMTPEGLEAVFRGFKKAFLERALNAELDAHLDAAEVPGNHRNGRTGKTVLTDEVAVRLDIPRDRAGSFEPQLVPKHSHRFAGFDDKIVSMYARGMSVREIQQHLRQMYAVEVSPDLISRVTDAVLEEVAAWQGRPLEAVYPLVFFDALRVKVRGDGVVHNKAVYLALGVQRDGTRDVLGLWIEHTEGAKFWLRVFTDLRNRGVSDILLGVADGLKGLPEALEAAFPADHAADLHRAPDPEQPRLRALARAQGHGGPAAPDLHRPQRRGRRSGLASPRGQPAGPALRHRRPGLAARLDAGGAVLRLPSRGAPDGLHHQRHRKRQCAAAQSDQDPWPLPHRRGGHQADLAGSAQHQDGLGQAPGSLDCSHEPVRDTVR